jgi:hypothetical protein
VPGSSKFLCLSPIIRGGIMGGRHRKFKDQSTRA